MPTGGAPEIFTGLFKSRCGERARPSPSRYRPAQSHQTRLLDDALNEMEQRRPKLLERMPKRFTLNPAVSRRHASTYFDWC